MQRLVQRWQLKTVPVVSAILLFMFLAGCLAFRLVSATHLLATNVEQQNMLHGWHAIIHDPLNAPYFVALRLIRYVNHSLFYARAVGAGLGLVLCMIFYFITRKWLNYQLALLGTIMFGTSSYFLFSDRQVTPLVLQMFVSLGLVALAATTHKTTRPRTMWAWIAVVPILLYIPGSIWLVLVAAIINNRMLRDTWGLQNIRQKALMTFIALFLLMPLIYQIVKQTITAHNVIALEAWAGVAQHGRLAALSGFTKSFILVPVHLFVHGNGDGISTLAAINISVSALALLGLYIHMRRRHDARWRFNIGMVLAAWFSIGLGGMDIIAMVPLLYLLATVGLAYLLSEWYKVFPRNPFARGFGFLLISVLVFANCLYNLRSYFVVEAHSPVAAQTFICPALPPRPSICPQGTL